MDDVHSPLSVCNGNGVQGTHCCYVEGKECIHLVRNQAGRKYACGLFLKHGSWEGVNGDPDYEHVGDAWARAGLPFNYCETFSPVQCCRRDG